MKQLDLLCYLDDVYIELLNYETQYKLLDETLSNNNASINIINMEENINSLKSINQNTKFKLKDSEDLLKEYDGVINEIRTKLYSGKIVNLKQLEYLNLEKNSIKQTINNTEIKILEYMEEIDKHEEKLLKMESLLIKVRRQNEIQKYKYKDMKKELIKTLKIKEIEINEIESKINNLLLIRYKTIKKNKVKAIAKVLNNVCKGCNMEIPKYIVEQLKKEELTYCENCGRILCKQDD